MHARAHALFTLVLLAGLALGTGEAHAQSHFFLETTADGVILIYQDTAAGFALPGDSPGFPITISEAGSYRLASNLIVPAGVVGIAIATDNVRLDLNGFTIM
jgi:hypothetical protein